MTWAGGCIYRARQSGIWGSPTVGRGTLYVNEVLRPQTEDVALSYHHYSHYSQE